MGTLSSRRSIAKAWLMGASSTMLSAWLGANSYFSDEQLAAIEPQ